MYLRTHRDIENGGGNFQLNTCNLKNKLRLTCIKPPRVVSATHTPNGTLPVYSVLVQVLTPTRPHRAYYEFLGTNSNRELLILQSGQTYDVELVPKEFRDIKFFSVRVTDV